MKPWLLIFLLFFAMALRADDLATTAQADLKTAVSQLRAQRSQIAIEKAALLKQYNELEAQVREQRRQWELLKLTAGQQGAHYEERRRQLANLEQQFGALQAALADYRINLQTNLHAAEIDVFQEQFGEHGENLTPVQARDLIDFGLNRLQEAQGGRILPGQAIGPSGELLTGTYFLWGPMTYFSTEWTNQSGFATEGDGLAPRLSLFSNQADGNALANVLAGQTADLPLDPSNGRALRLTQEHENFSEHIRSGGIWVWPILTLAALAIIVVLLKSVQIVRIRLPDEARIDDVLKALATKSTSDAKAKMDTFSDPTKSLLSDAMERVSQPREVLEDVLLEHVIRWQLRWERGLAVLAVTAAVSPLLGLLGTVTGMIATFRLIGVYGSGDARPLSGGISEALVTTELGLMVAIPALIAHALLSRKVQSLISDLESLATRFLDGLQNPPSKETHD